MRRTGLVLSILGALLITAVWYFFVISPMNERIDAAEVELQSAVDQRVLLQTQLNRLKRIQENELTYRSAIGALETAVPPTPQMPALIETLAELAEDSGVLWNSGTYGNPAVVEDQDYFEIPISLTVEGQFFEVLAYLYGIADLDRIVRVDAISLTPSQDEDGFTIETVTISAKAFTTGNLMLPVVVEEETSTTTTSTTTTTSGSSE